jgi:hypothetical protein
MGAVTVAAPDAGSIAETTRVIFLRALMGGGLTASSRKTGLRSRRHHQYHDPCAPEPMERHET